MNAAIFEQVSRVIIGRLCIKRPDLMENLVIIPHSHTLSVVEVTFL